MNESVQKVHFIAVGGSVMHNLAIALHRKGYEVTGSDDEIFEPSAGRLAEYGLLPTEKGWFPEKIRQDLNAVILGMHAREDNPELLAAKEKEIKIYSYPEYILAHCHDKQRVVVAGSHGKTSVTSLIIHVLNFHKKTFDYVCGTIPKGFDCSVKLSEDAPVIIIEGDEYTASPIDKQPKFLVYEHHIGVITGIARDHINVFPTEESYTEQFIKFADASPKGGILIYNADDKLTTKIAKKERVDLQTIGYHAHKNGVKDGVYYLVSSGEKIPVKLFGQHNMLNISAAKEVCLKLGITPEMFYEALQHFEGVTGRLELLSSNDNTFVFKDFAHAPSKLKAATEATKSRFPNKKLIACIELHSFSSLNKDFLPQYRDTMKAADIPLVYFNPETVKHKKLENIHEKDIVAAFGDTRLKVFTNSQALKDFMLGLPHNDSVFLLMSSGNFDGLNLKELAENITS